MRAMCAHLSNRSRFSNCWTALAATALVLLGASNAQAANPFGSLDLVTRTRVAGWAVDPDVGVFGGGGNPVAVHVYVDDTFLTAFAANAFRPDVGHHAFDVAIPALGPGPHLVKAYVIGVSPNNVPDGYNPLIGSRTVNSVPTGWWSMDTAHVVTGWAQDQDSSASLQMHIYVDGRFYDLAPAILPSAGHGNHGFRYDLSSFGAGAHTVVIAAIGLDGAGVPDGINGWLRAPDSFTPSCSGLRANAPGWCSAVPFYYQTRMQDSERLVSSAALVEINHSHGGALFRLFGADRSWNLIDENGGAAIQLSLWGMGTNDEQDSQPPPCERALANWDYAKRPPFNPIQAQQTGCSWAPSLNDSNNASVSAVNGGLRTVLDNPVNFTYPTAFSGLHMTQTTQLDGPRVHLRYDFNMDATAATAPIVLDPHPQEIPAIHLALGPQPVVHYQDASGAVLTHQIQPGENRFKAADLQVQIPGHDSFLGTLHGNWYSVCSSDGQSHCVTVHYPSQAMIWEVNFSVFRDPATLEYSTYATPTGYFALVRGYRFFVDVDLFPYHYNDWVDGQTILERVRGL